MGRKGSLEELVKDHKILMNGKRMERRGLGLSGTQTWVVLGYSVPPVTKHTVLSSPPT